MRRFLTWLVLEPGDRIVRVKSLWPCLMRTRGRWELSWPTLLVDRRYGWRETQSAIWDRVRFRLLWEKTYGWVLVGILGRARRLRRRLARPRVQR